MSEANTFPSSSGGDIFYHGSAQAGITHLEPRSKLHNSDKMVVYLTNSMPYALFYLWDERHTGCAEKHVTGWTQKGIAYYMEQFPDQLEAFYCGASGYLYTFSAPADVRRMEKRDGIFYSEKSVEVAQALYIPDVYHALLREETAGTLRVLRYREQSPQRQEELTDLIADMIASNNFFCDDDTRSAFMQRFFTRAWNRAEERRA